MGIVGDRPESGVRLELERPREGGPPWKYQGRAATAEGAWPVEATISADGAVTLTGPDLAPAVQTKALLILRAAFKNADGPPPRKILRWRGEK